SDFFFFFQAEDGIRDFHVTGVQTCALPISTPRMMAMPSSGTPTLLSTVERMTMPAPGADGVPSDAAMVVTSTRINIGSVSSSPRSEERRVGKECRTRRARKQHKQNTANKH